MLQVLLQVLEIAIQLFSNTPPLYTRLWKTKPRNHSALELDLLQGATADDGAEEKICSKKKLTKDEVIRLKSQRTRSTVLGRFLVVVLRIFAGLQAKAQMHHRARKAGKTLYD